MEIARFPDTEERRLQTLLSYDILDTQSETCYNELVELASYICGTPIALVSLVDSDRQWFKAKVGIDAEETSRDIAFCSHAILQESVFEVHDASQDTRFSDNPLVTEHPDIRFYAGAPLFATNGEALGTLCVIDRKPGELSQDQRRALQALANQVISQLELRRSAKALKELNEGKDKFFAMMSHDLRSPFQIVLGFASRLRSHIHKMSADDIKHSAERIQLAADQAFRLLSNLLDLSKFQLGGFSFSPESLNVADLVEEIKLPISELLAAKDITFEVDITPEMKVFADKLMMQSVLTNLIINSIKFTPKGGTVNVAVNTQDKNVVLMVADSGVGMSPEKVESLFNDDECATSLGTEGEKGSGLGMNLCKSFVDQHQGKIWVESQENKGSQFYVSLPDPSAV